MSLSGSVETGAVGQPAGDDRGGRVAVGPGQRGRGQAPGSRPEREAREIEAIPRPRRAFGRLGRLGRLIRAAPQGLDGFTARPRDHEPRRYAAGQQRSDHRPGRGADDVIGAARVPAALRGDRVERPDEPGPAQDASGAEHEADPRAPRGRWRGGVGHLRPRVRVRYVMGGGRGVLGGGARGRGAGGARARGRARGAGAGRGRGACDLVPINARVAHRDIPRDAQSSRSARNVCVASPGPPRGAGSARREGPPGPDLRRAHRPRAPRDLAHRPPGGSGPRAPAPRAVSRPRAPAPRLGASRARPRRLETSRTGPGRLETSRTGRGSPNSRTRGWMRKPIVLIGFLIHPSVIDPGLCPRAKSRWIDAPAAARIRRVS